MFLLLLEQLLVGTNSPCPVCKGIEYTVFCSKVVMAVSVKELVCVDRFLVYCC